MAKPLVFKEADWTNSFLFCLYILFVENGDRTELQDFPVELKKSKFRMDNLVVPIHFEFGPSKVTETEDKIRYSILAL